MHSRIQRRQSFTHERIGNGSLHGYLCRQPGHRGQAPARGMSDGGIGVLHAVKEVREMADQLECRSIKTIDFRNLLSC